MRLVSRFLNFARWKQIDELFDAVLEIQDHGREEFLSKKCDGDADLKREVLSLLAAQKETVRFMENSAMNLMAKEFAYDRPADFSLIGKEFGTYKIEKPIGAGGMGEVYLAHDDKLNRKVALKILPAEFVTDPERIKRFEREARMISALNHPFIVTIYDVGSAADGVNYIATEYVEGETVRDLINRGADLKQTLSIISQTCEALAAAHKAGIVHRDIKPENIMIRPDGFVKVLDFGLAKLSDQTDFQQNLSNYTMKGIIIGTPAYMSPAQVSAEKIDHRTDLWSIGVCLYEMLTGKNPFKGESRQATFQKILLEDPPLVSASNPALPAGLEAILSKALEKDADVSYQTASDFNADLKRVRREIDSSPSLGNGSSTQIRTEKNAKTRKSYFVYAAGVVLLAASGLGIWSFASRQKLTNAIDWSKATNIQLTDQPGTEYFPALAPDGKSFVYASDALGNFDLYIQRVGSKKASNLTPDSPANDTQPAFSPDGEKIAFRSEREPKGIYVMGAAGENLRRVADFGYHPSWSPDGQELVVSTFGLSAPSVRMGRDNKLLIINVQSGARRELINEEAAFPAWSPNGKRIAYWYYAKGAGRRDIATIAARGGDPVVITKDFATSNWNPVWSPDGQFLYFVSDKNGNLNFWRVAIDEATGAVLSPPEPVVAPSKYSRHLGFSRDGKRMIYVQTDNQSNIQAIGFDAKTEKIIGEPFWITRGEREVIRAELSPDGRQFVMRQVRRTKDDIVTVNRDGSDWRDITNDAPFDRYPRWAPDGKQIAFASDRNINTEIWTSDPDGSNLRQITFQYNSEFGSSFPTWSPDGRSIIYTNNSQPFLVDLTKSWSDQQAPQKVLPPEINTDFIVWDWSPDGKKLIGTLPDGARTIAMYSFETGRLERVVENVDDKVPSWLPDSRQIIFETDNKFFITDTETKKTREIFSRQPENIRAPFVSRDGRLLYYTVYLNESNIWLLDVSQNP